MSTPSLDSLLPDLMPFVRSLARDYNSGALNDWDGAADRVQTFYTPDRMEAFEAVIPGWKQMASYADGQTLIHVSLVFTALWLLPEYQSAPPDHQRLAEWIVAFHDVAKQPRRGSHDWTHGFRSAALAGRALPRIGFPLLNDDPVRLSAWADLTCAAMIPHPTEETTMHDNSQLPAILDGIHYLFGESTPASIIIKGVLFHMSIDVVSDYPTAAPLTDAEIRHFIDPATLPLLKIMMLVDCDGWALFDPLIKARDRAAVLAVFDRLNAQMDSHDDN